MKLKKLILLFLLSALFLSGCGVSEEYTPLAATTLPVYEFTSRLCLGTDLTVTRLVTESVSCLHDYSLNVSQVKSAEAADTVICSGAGLEEFMADILLNADTIDASAGIEIIEYEEGHDHHEVTEHQNHEGHHHDRDSHIWLSPANAAVMAQNICDGLCQRYPSCAVVFQRNLEELLADLDELYTYGTQSLADLSCRELITFHDGFSYFAECFDLHILKAVEEESGSEASASELKELICMVREYDLPAIFTETNGSDSAAAIIARETGIPVYTLDMAMSGQSYFDAMYHNIDTIKEALG